ncbi:variable large family protein (plasmid) [Borrelia coriaceae]|uniref:Variable large protein n=1 Tax=Borrelia coriaceae ATCC 43381 TaxID=1408429 RepID=W5SWH9_9SPIR|nr:Variable outer membrane protein [Borrelia coriaceae ATCC 43381]UPA17152.1 variable large family protein [Borrelia coriaceae]
MNNNPANIKQDAVIAGAIALRAMAKSGKFTGPSSSTGDYVIVVKGAAVSAVNTLTIAIRKTIDERLKIVKDTMKLSTNDAPVINETVTNK